MHARTWRPLFGEIRPLLRWSSCIINFAFEFSKMGGSCRFEKFTMIWTLVSEGAILRTNSNRGAVHEGLFLCSRNSVPPLHRRNSRQCTCFSTSFHGLLLFGLLCHPRVFPLAAPRSSVPSHQLNFPLSGGISGQTSDRPGL